MKKVKRLTFGEYLKELPSSIVFEHLVKGQAAGRKIISADLIDGISREFTTGSSCRQRFEALSFEARKVCVLAYLFGSLGVKAVEFDAVHDELVSSFLVYVALDKYKIPFYFGFTDTAPVLAPVCTAFLCEHAAVTVIDSPVPYLRTRCLNDFSVVLVQALRGVVMKKRDGTLAQASYTTLKKLLHATKESCVFRKKSEDTGAIVQLLLAYGTARDYLTEDEKGYHTTHAQAIQWLSHSSGELYKDLIDFAVEYSGNWNRTLFEEVVNTADNTWLSTALFPASCRPQVYTLLLFMHYVGVVDALPHGAEIAWRGHDSTPDRHEASEMRRKVHILPDFSAVVPQEVPPDGIYAFSLFGNITQFDKVYRGTIRREAVNETLSRGIAGEVLITHLSQWETPVNVLETVKEWIREFSRLSVVSSEMIVSFDEKTSRQIGSYEPLQSFIERIDAHAVFTVKKGREKEVRDILAAMGYDPRVPGMQSAKAPALERMVFKDTWEEFTIIHDFNKPSQPRSRPVASGKYSSELRERELNELFHVVDYAILMGYAIQFEYEGSPYIRQDVYTVIPKKIINDTDPFIEGTIEESKAKKKFFMKRIKRIGVLSE